MKLCKYCNIEKDLSLFTIRKDSKDGYRNKCKDCSNSYAKENGVKYKGKYLGYSKEDRVEYNKEYNMKNRDSILCSKKRYYQDNKESILLARKLNRDSDYQNNYNKKYRDENLEYFKIYRREYESYKRETDPLYKLTANLRSMIRESLTVRGYSKTSKSIEVIGITFDEFKIYIESKFEPWMTWDNYGRYNGELNYGWDIDHIIPLSSAISEDEVVILNHYTNLQPLCSKTNRYIKRDKICRDFQN